MKKPIPFGKYYLLDRISVGGMAEVFKAKAFGVEGFERLIAVKRILPSIAEDEEFITMFIDEAKIAVQLQHANIAQIFDLGKVGDSYFIAMEYVPGKDMRTIFERMRKTGKTVPIPMAAYFAMKVCEGLDYAHNKKDAAGRDLNLVHRDVSPQNILISYDGELKIIDFGIAKAAGKAGKTQAGILKGKFGYMSPEQVRGLPLDRRSDIFAVGICLWEMVTGERLFVGESDFATLEKVRNVDITAPSSFNPGVPEELEKIILKALSKEVEDRYQTAMDFHDDLQNWMYTSGNFFARKDLNAFMQEVFGPEIEKEAASMEGSSDGVISTVPPPPKPASQPKVGAAQPSTAPAVPARTAQPRPAPPPAPPRPSAGFAPPPPMQGRPGLQRTELGMGRPPKAPAQAPPASNDLPLNLVGGDVLAVGPPPGQSPELGMEDWDAEEPPTSVYSKQASAALAQAAVAKKQQATGATQRDTYPPAPWEGAPTSLPSGPIVTPVQQPQIIQRSIAPIVIGISAALIVVALVVIMIIKLLPGTPPVGTLRLEITPVDNLKVIVDNVKELPGNMSPFTLPVKADEPHVILIQSPGYRDYPLTFQVERGETLKKVITMDKVATGFFLETDPPGATVWVNDRPLEEKTPVTVDNLKPGLYNVRITKDRYAVKNIEIEVIDGEIKKLPVKKLNLKEVEVAFETDPPGADVVLLSDEGERPVGSTPCSYTIDPAGKYRAKFLKRGYETVDRKIEPEEGQSNVTLFVKLTEGSRAPAIAHVAKTKTAPKASARASDDEESDEAPPARRPSGGGGGAAPAAGGGGFGTLSVQTRPWSKVFINGEFIKNTPLVNYKLKAGTYRVTVENSDYNIKKEFSATIQADKATTLVRRLM